MNNGLDFEICEDEPYGTNFYTAALSLGSPELVRACIHNGASVDSADMSTLYLPFPKVSPLYIAISAGRTDIVKVLLEEGSNIEALFRRGIAWNLRNTLCPENSEQVTDFRRSLDNGTKIIEVFMKAGKQISGLDGRYSTASFFNLDYNADVLRNNLPLPMKEIKACFKTAIYDDFMPYLFPCQGTRTSALWHYAAPEAMKEALMTQNPNVQDKAGWTALHHIAMYGGISYYFMPEKIIQVLADSGADINAENKYRASPLMIASAKAFLCERMFESVKILIRNGADYRMKDKGRNAKNWLLNGNGGRYGFQTAMIEEIYDEITNSAENIGFPNINLHTAYDYTPLMRDDVFNDINDINTVKYFLEHGADISVRNREGETALSLADKNSDTEKMTLIIEYGGDYTKNTQAAKEAESQEITYEAETLRRYGLRI